MWQTITVMLLFCLSCPDMLTADTTVCNPYIQFDTLLRDYNRTQPPPNYPVTVTAEIIIHNIRSVSGIDSTAIVFIHFIARWKDTRLQGICGDQGGESVILGESESQKIWTPALVMDSSMRNDFSKAVRAVINSSGHIDATYQFAGTVPCGSDFVPFPFDHLSCDVVFGSSYAPNLLQLSWLDEKNPAMLIKEHLKLSEYWVEGDANLKKCPEGGCLWYDLRLNRYTGYYILQAYVPSALVVGVASLSFLLGADILATRISLGISALIAMTLQHGKVVADLPKVGYIKGIDVWMLGCTIFVLLAIGQSAMLAFYKRYRSSDEKVLAKLPAMVSLVDKLTGVCFLALCGIFIIVYVCIWT